MYKNVLNQCTIALILLFSSYFTSNAQTVSANPPISYANADLKSEHPPSEKAITTKTAETDTTWKPVRRLWGYAFGDYYYNARADASNRGAETNYNGVPTYRNAFQFRRIYLGYDYDISKKFSVELLLASEPSANTGVVGATSTSTSTTTLTGVPGGTATTTTKTTTTTTVSSGDNLVDNKMAFYIKLINLRWKGIWSGTDLVIGEMLTPSFPMLTEKIWGYRSIERTISDFHRTNAYDIGASLQGVFDPSEKNFVYNILVANNAAGSSASLGSASNANTGFYKAFYGDVYAKLLNQTLIFDLYADYMRTAPATVAVGGQSHSMIKGFVAYTTPKITFGLEAYTQKIANGVTNTTTKLSENATVEAISIYAHGAIYKDKLGFFARYDGYNPDNDYNAADAYTVNTNLPAYSPFAKEHFYTAGLDFTPAKNVHFEPNLWLIDYKDQRDPSTTGYVADDHTLVYRLTFFYIFGK